MRRISVFVVLTMTVFMFVGCATTGKQVAPVGCEKSVYYKNSQLADSVLKGMVIGAHGMAFVQPAYYQAAHASAQMVVKALQNKPMSIEEISKLNQTDFIVSSLVVIFPPDMILDQCDVAILIKYLSMV